MPGRGAGALFSPRAITSGATLVVAVEWPTRSHTSISAVHGLSVINPFSRQNIVHLTSLHLTNFRNFTELSLELEPGGALFKGPNGSGKTNLLEAVHLLCMAKSQRGARRTEMIHHASAAACVRGTFRGGNAETNIEARIGFDRSGALRMARGGRPVATRREWFSGCAVVAFGPEDLQLITGGPGERRRFMDMLLSQVEPSYLEQLVVYNRALANRNRLLSDRASAQLLEVYETQLAERGAFLYEQRTCLMAVCQDIFADSHAGISGQGEVARLAFGPSISPPKTGGESWQDVFFHVLKNNRKRDIELGYTSRGPHRDDLLVFLDERPAKAFASQGQLRSLALALRLCAVRLIERLRGESMVVLVDDAFSELDDERIARVYPLVRCRGQVLMATPVDRVPLLLDIPKFVVRDAGIRRL
jgi:DNA replication and repair protein RecF